MSTDPLDDEQYLWDGTGVPDPDVQRLEALLAPLAARPEPLALALSASGASWSPLPWRSCLAAAAVVLVAVGVATRMPRPDVGGDPWRVARVEGLPTLAAAPLARHARIAEGRWIETGAGASAVMFVGRIGRLEVAPGSRLRVTTAAPGDHRAELVRGTIQAQIWAPPGQFVIDTPSATTVDLGCAYTLTVDDAGRGLITVEGGWVGFEHQGREAFIPAGATGRTYPGRGPGIPAYVDAPAALREAVDALDLADDVVAQAGPLTVVLREARREDALTLWHLLTRVDASLVPQVVDRLDTLVPMPAGVTREGVLAGNRAMRDAWWDALGLGTTSWWRTWRQQWNDGR
ncbi:hypothetical protein TBR22_A44650 [Luteitalea sp. TBR-22]|uniref:hypothetical protein n=1 Tax=Luteitalea sp. TBR-22 TaxID=2802971 RepID=UPI001AFC9075|nr:hypothetical protein [Luteitalea sp. TBR-22]BCS35238.1 hypothetical protein TBR22_A44650 [Luteitalea sp. TBR-22]